MALNGILDRLALPLIVAPMTGVSGPDLVASACIAGLVGAFPTRNCESVEQLDEWLCLIEERRLKALSRAPGANPGPIAANLIIRGNKRLSSDIEVLARHALPLVITSVGSPAELIEPLHAKGISVLADVASMHHAEKALEAGADGLVLLTAGSGGHTGRANPLAFLRAVRAEFAGPIVLSGGISDGAALWAAIVLGADLAYMGTRFIATEESLAGPDFKQALIESSLDDIELAIAPNGVVASLIKGGRGSAGHSVSAVASIVPASTLIEEVRDEWDAARRATARLVARE